MAKRTTPPSPQGEPGATGTPQPKPPRSRTSREPKGVAVDKAAEPAVAVDKSAEPAAEMLPDVPEPGDVADQAARSESISVSPEPSEEDIRLRAYHRYLERGAGHGAHFDDWLEAERELKRRRDDKD